jgi:hypothetical protein
VRQLGVAVHVDGDRGGEPRARGTGGRVTPPTPKVPAPAKTGKRKQSAVSFIAPAFACDLADVGSGVIVELPIRLVSEANAHEHWRVKAKRVKEQRAAVLRWLTAHLAGSTLQTPLEVTITRIAPRAMDSDNAVGSAKHCRDAVAEWLGRKDGPSDPITWDVKQESRGARVYGVRIEVRETAEVEGREAS